MAASNKPGPIHFVAIGLFMLSIILGVLAFLSHRSHKEALAREQAAQGELSTTQQDRTQKKDEIDALKTLLGFSEGVIGLNDEGNEGTVLGASRASIKKYAKDLEAPSFKETLINMSASIDKNIKEKLQTTADYEKMKQEYAALEERHRSQENLFQEKAQEAEKEVQDLTEIKDREVAKRDEQIQKANNLTQQQQIQIETLKEEKDQVQKESERENESLAKINDELRDKQHKESKYSFEIPDGIIRRVDHVTGLVWLNLGRADGLKPRTTFSVYNKDNQSVGKDISDIKGKIEVISILGAHESEARILEDNITRPIFRNDLVYTPLWAVGQVNSFSFVGKIDLDGDGISDRERLHAIIESAGAKIDNEVTDEGELIGDGITIDTRYLVLGKIPGLEEVLEDEKAAIIATQRIRSDLTKQARINGVETINLSDFLSLIGYHPSRRVWAPGTDSPWTLELGKRPTGISATSLSRKPIVGRGTNAYGGGRRSINSKTSTRRTDRVFRSTRGVGR